MKKLLATMLSCALVASSTAIPTAVLATDAANNLVEQSRVAAFKGAEGGGMWTTGARAALENNGVMEVYHVTNLNDSGEGSFRDAVSKSNRIVVFDVSGYIDLASNVTIGRDNITILGQTAPGDGVCFRSNNIKIGANNVILRYIRFRVGAHDANGNDTRAQDGLEVTDDCQNVIIDHCSVSWGTDENLSAYAVKDVTIQNSIIAEALNQSVHDKGEHSYAAIWGGVNLSVHHNIIASHKSRNPKVGTSETVAMTAGYTDAQTLVDLKNNIFYNWGDKAGYGSENGAKTFIQNNIYRPGPATPSGKRSRIFEISVGQKYQTNMFGSVYANGNYIDVDSNDTDYANAQLVNANNWQDEKRTGVYTAAVDGDKTNIKLEEPTEEYKAYEAEYPITLDKTEDVYEKVLANAGATLPKRDAVDERIIENVKNRTAPTGSKGSVGLVDDPTDCIPEGATNYDDRGYPTLSEETRAADYDTDKDGISDAWEDAHGLNKNNPLDSVKIGPEGYTWLEIFVEDEITKSEYSDNLEINLEVSTETELGADTTITASNLGSNVKTVDFYCDGTLLGSVDSSTGNAVLTTKNISAGTKYISAVAKDENGHSNVSNTVITNCAAKTESFSSDGWTGTNVTISDGNYIIGTGASISKTVKGDFDYVAEISEMGNSEATSELKLSIDGTTDSISYGYDNYTLNIKAGSEVVSGIDCNTYKLLKISRTGNDLKLYVGRNLVDWKEIGSSALSDENATLKLEANGGVGILNMLRVITSDMKSAPKAQISNIVENQRLDFKENIDIEVEPDAKAGVSEIYVYLNINGVDKTLAEYKAENPITSKTTVTVPVEFSTVANGALKVVCIDQNLGTSIDTKNVVVSQDITPWKIADIGQSENDEKTYVSATNDYTFKINSGKGNIGGKSDDFGFMYQQFSGDSRLYYRSRMQEGKQFGVVIKSDLEADGPTYFFGGNNVDGELKYQLMARYEKGGEMQLVKDVGLSGSNLYFITEKIGDTLYIYQTENGATIYNTKTLLASVKLDGIGDTYYMGYGVTYPSTYVQNPSDSGWYGMDTIQTDGISYEWNFDNGLDWLWQMQESNVLQPKFSSESIAGNTSGKLMIAPDESYTGDRYIFREYLMQDKYLPKMNADVYLNGDAPAMNVYFQTGSLDSAYKLTFADDGKIYANAGSEITATDTALGEWSVGNWYSVEIAATLDETTNFEQQYKLTVKDNNGNTVASLDNMPISSSGKFRTQINTAKKTSVTRAVYFEPVAAAKGSYYIDNVKVTAVQGRYEVVKTENFLSFANEADGALGNKTYDNGFEVKAGLSVSGKNKTIVDETFSKRVQMDKGSSSSSAIVIPTGISGEGSCDIQIYAEQGGSSGERYMVLHDGKKEVAKILIGATNRFDYTYTGSAEKLFAYSTSKIYVYGIKTVNTAINDTMGGEVKPEPKTTAINGFDPQTGKVSLTYGTDIPENVTVVVASYDANGILMGVANSAASNTVADTEAEITVSGIASAASYKVFLFNSMESISPLCESVKY